MHSTRLVAAAGPALAAALLLAHGAGDPIHSGRALRSAAAMQSPGLPAAKAPAEESLAILNGRVFDGTGSIAIDDGVVLVRGNRVVAVGPADRVEIPADARRLDAQGGTIMPGVIDSHVHFFPTLTHRFTRGQDIVTPWIEAGVTTVVDTGSVRHMTRASRALVDALPHPPRLFMAGPILTAPGGYPTTRREADAAMIAWEVKGAEDAYATVVRLIENEGVDLIKVAIETGSQTDYREDGWPVLSPEELSAIARAAHERGKRVRAHVSNPGEMEAALVAGIDALAHTPIHPVPDELLRRAVDAGMVFTSTANIWGANRGAIVAATLRRVHDLGGVVAIGTDHPYQRGSEMPVNEMALLAAAGFTPAELLVCATRNGARALGLESEMGTLEAGKLADVIVVAGKPDENLQALHDVRVVIRDGEVVKQSSAPTAHPRRELRSGEVLVHLATPHGEIDLGINTERARDTGLRHGAGTVSMARGAPDSATSDFFILLDEQPSLDVVRAIQQQPVEAQRLIPPVPILKASRVR